MGGDNGNPGFMYTVGLTAKGIPEIYVYGYAPSLQGLINTTVSAALKRKPDNPDLPNCDYNLDVVETDCHMGVKGEDLRYKVRVVTDRTIPASNMLSCTRRYGDGFDIVQLVYGDVNNILPDEDGYTKPEQPLY